MDHADCCMAYDLRPDEAFRKDTSDVEYSDRLVPSRASTNLKEGFGLRGLENKEPAKGSKALDLEQDDEDDLMESRPGSLQYQDLLRRELFPNERSRLLQYRA